MIHRGGGSVVTGGNASREEEAVVIVRAAFASLANAMRATGGCPRCVLMVQNASRTFSITRVELPNAAGKFVPLDEPEPPK